MKIEDTLVENNSTLKETMRQIDKNSLGTAFIVDKNKRFLGVVTDGDIRRAILKGVGLDEPIEGIMNTKPTVGYSFWSDETLKEKLKNSLVFKEAPVQAIVRIPILDKENRVKKVLFVSGKGMGEKRIKVYLNPNESQSIKKVLVIGGAGYLGSVTVRKLLGKGYKVRVLDNLTYGDAGIKELYNKPGFEFAKGDVRDLSAVTNAIKGVDAVIHLTAIVGDPASALSPSNTIEINYLAVRMVAEVCKFHQINRFLFASTCSVYGSSKNSQDLLDENSELKEISLYAKMKSQSEKALLEMRDKNFAPTILRLATLYGLSPRMRFDLAVNVITARAIFDKQITIFGGSQWRPFLHVEDAAEAFIKCLEAPLEKVGGKFFNTGSGKQNYQLGKIGEIIHKIVPEATFVQTEAEDERDYNVCFDKIKNELGFDTAKGIEEGVEEIKEAICSKKFSDYRRKEYANHKCLQENSKMESSQNKACQANKSSI